MLQFQNVLARTPLNSREPPTTLTACVSDQESALEAAGQRG
jgi:hypothetical protein